MLSFRTQIRMLALLAGIVVSNTFISCGGDDDDAPSSNGPEIQLGEQLNIHLQDFDFEDKDVDLISLPLPDGRSLLCVTVENIGRNTVTCGWELLRTIEP